jgi:hypothetical protein
LSIIPSLPAHFFFKLRLYGIQSITLHYHYQTLIVFISFKTMLAVKGIY